MYTSCGLHLVLFFCSVLQIGYSTCSRQFSGLLTSGFAFGQKITELSRSHTITYRYYRPDDKKEDSIHLDAKLKVMIRGSLKAKLPPALTINSTNLRVLDPIGQGMGAA